MAVVNLKSTPVSNADASPIVITDASLAFGVVHKAKGVVLGVLSTDNIGSVYRFARVKSSDIIDQVVKRNTALGGSCTMDVGVYQTAERGGAVVDADLFGSAVSMVAADLVGTDVTHESGVYTILLREQRLWQLLGLTADPQREYDLAFTCVAVPASNGTMVGDVAICSHT